jgi:hypothetical protein
MTENAHPTSTAWPSRWRAPRHGQRDRAGSCEPGTERDSYEVDPAVDQHFVPADEVQERGRNDSGERGEREHRDAPVSHLVCVSARDGRA